MCRYSVPFTKIMTHPRLSPRRELGLLLTIAGIQFTHILDFMIMMPLGPQFTRLFGITDAQFGLRQAGLEGGRKAAVLVGSTAVTMYR